MLLLHQGKEENQFQFYMMNFVKSKHFPRGIPVNPARYFNERLLNFNQYFA